MALDNPGQGNGPPAHPGQGNGARPPVLREKPVTLEDHLSRAYAARYKLEGIDSETEAAVAGMLKGSGIPKGQLQAARDRCFAVQERCIVSRMQREFLDRVIAELP
jgi:hypothetical protein